MSLVYAPDGEDYLVVPSLGGADESPAWLTNVRARPRVGMQVARRRFPLIATVVQRSDPDHARLWRIADENNRRRCSRYQAKTKRPIPVVRLTPWTHLESSAAGRRVTPGKPARPGRHRRRPPLAVEHFSKRSAEVRAAADKIAREMVGGEPGWVGRPRRSRNSPFC